MSSLRASGILVWVTVLWVALWHDVSVANVLSGIGIGLVVLAVSGVASVVERGRDETSRVAPLALLRFAGFVLYKLVEANLFLAWEILTPQNRIHVGVVSVPLRTESRTAALVVANVITLTPGTITLQVVGSPPVLYVNVMHLHDVDRVRADLLTIERKAVEAFGSDAARTQLVERS